MKIFRSMLGAVLIIALSGGNGTSAATTGSSIVDLSVKVSEIIGTETIFDIKVVGNEVYIGATSGKFLKYNAGTGAVTDLSDRLASFWEAVPVRALAYDTTNQVLYLGGGTKGKFARYNTPSYTGGNPNYPSVDTAYDLSLMFDLNENYYFHNMVYDFERGDIYASAYENIYCGSHFLLRYDIDSDIATDNLNNCFVHCGACPNTCAAFSLAFDFDTDTVFVGSRGSGWGGLHSYSIDSGTYSQCITGCDNNGWWGGDGITGNMPWSIVYDAAAKSIYMAGHNWDTPGGDFLRYDISSNNTASLTGKLTALWGPNTNTAPNNNNLYTLAYDSRDQVVFIGGNLGKFARYNTPLYESGIHEEYPDPDTAYLIDLAPANWGANPVNALAYNKATGAVYLGGANGKFAVFKPAQDGLISYWNFDEESGQVAHDSLGVNHGGLGSTAGVDMYDPVRTSGIGGALRFDGVNDYVYVPDSDSLHLGTDPFSIQMWIKADTFAGRSSSLAGIRVLRKSLYPSTWWVVDILPDGRVQMEMGDSNSVVSGQASICAITTGNWYHVTIVVDRVNFEVRYYINGTPAGTQPIPGEFEGNLDVAGKFFDIGSMGWNTFNGIIDELAIYRRTLSAEEIEQQYLSDLQRLGEVPGSPECPNTHSPVADAGPDQTIECSGPDGAEVVLDGSGSSGPEGDTLTYTWTWDGGSADGVNPRVILPYGTTTVTLTVEDGKGNSATDELVVTVADTTPPSTAVMLAGIPGENGWYVSDVDVTLTSTDTCTGVKEIRYIINDQPEQAVPGDTTAFTLTEDGTHTVTYWAIDNAGNAEYREARPIKAEATPPITTPVVPPPPADGNDYYRDCVPVKLTAAASDSGIAVTEYSLDNGKTWQTYNGEFPVCATVTVTYRTISNAGNVEEPKTITINIDRMPPVITANVSPAPNANGWHNTDVTVAFTCTDSGSGIAQCPQPIVVTTEGAGQVITGAAKDKAGNTASTSVILNIDKTAPAANISVTPGILWPPNKKMVDVAVKGGATDAASGIESVLFTTHDEYGIVQPVVSGFNTTIPVEAWREGADRDGRRYTITAVITDKAGNTSTVSTEAVCPHDMRDKR